MARYMVHIHLNPSEGNDAAFAQWYEDIHLPELLETVDGLISGRRYWLRAVSGAEPPNRHVAVYEIEAATPDAAIAAFHARRDERVYAAETIDGSTVSFQVFEADGPEHRQP